MLEYTEEELNKVINAFNEMLKLKKDDDVKALASAIGSFDSELEQHLIEIDRLIKNNKEEEAGEYGKIIRKTHNRKNS